MVLWWLVWFVVFIILLQRNIIGLEQGRQEGRDGGEDGCHRSIVKRRLSGTYYKNYTNKFYTNLLGLEIDTIPTLNLFIIEFLSI